MYTLLLFYRRLNTRWKTRACSRRAAAPRRSATVRSTASPASPGTTAPLSPPNWLSEDTLRSPECSRWKRILSRRCDFQRDCMSFQPVMLMLILLSNLFVVLQECELGEHNNPVHDIAWAPAMGRSYHLIATASREPTFKVFFLISEWRTYKYCFFEYTGSLILKNNYNDIIFIYFACPDPQAESPRGRLAGVRVHAVGGEHHQVQRLARRLERHRHRARYFRGGRHVESLETRLRWGLD